MRINYLCHFTLIVLMFSCNSDSQDQLPTDTLVTEGSHFKMLSPQESGVHFVNMIKETKEFHHLMWESVFYGGGVAVGDINNDGLPDLYFTGNQVKDALYLNKGNLQFEDISVSAGIDHIDGWSTGVTMVDVNADGLLDIYVCKSWWDMDDQNIEGRRNKLLINNGDLTFTDQAASYGLDDPAHSTQATFFDYDRDGDLDMYLMNMPSNNFKQKLEYIQKKQIPYKFSDKLYENLGRGKFNDKTKEAGIENYAFGLGLIAADINQDGWTDLYVACDYEQPDRFFINNKNGTFTNRTPNDLKHTSYSSMGCDIADFNNDMLPDIAVLDMQSADHVRAKTNMPTMNATTFWKNVSQGYGFQYMSNALQLNNGWGFYSEIAQLAGIASTDWSWSVLLADLDNDQFKDIYITNGVNRDMRNSDLIEKMKNIPAGEREKKNLLKLAKEFPSQKLPNYLYHNNGDLTFDNKIKDWGLHSPGFSFGSAYSDLDQDGDLDLIVCNSNESVHIFKNKNPNNHHWLQIKVKGNKVNPSGLGTKAILYHGKKKQYQELSLTRGFQSSVEPLLHFGLGNLEKVDSLVLIFPNQKTKVLKNISVNQRLAVAQKEADQQLYAPSNFKTPIFQDVTKQSGIKFSHQENKFDDFSREILLPHMQSKNGPYISTGDVNGDRLDDFFIGGAAGQAGVMYLQQSNGEFSPASKQVWSEDKSMEDMGSILADFDEDNDLDLYVVSGGGQQKSGHPLLQDRIYLNDGKGAFVKEKGIVPEMGSNGSCVRASDIDKDGDLDLFVGGNVRPGEYPKAAESMLLINNGGRFSLQTEQLAPGLQSIGMVTDATWTDYDNDGWPDLIIVGEWMSPVFFHNENGQLVQTSAEIVQQDIPGWWFHINPADIDQDGDIDFVVGNMGLNNKYHPNEEKPLYVYGNDFDQNKTNDIVLAKTTSFGTVPVRGRECSSEQMPFVATKFKSFESFAKATLEEIYGDGLTSAIHYTAKEFRSGLLINDGKGHFSFNPLPNKAQIAPIQGSIVKDFNQDGILDLIVAGNHFDAEVETVRHDAGNGLLLLGSKEGTFKAVDQKEAQFYVPFNTKDLVEIQNYKRGKGLILSGNNNFQIRAYEFEK